VAAIMHNLAFFFAAQFDTNPAFLQCPVKKAEEGSKAEQKAIKAFDRKYASLPTPEVIERLVAVWDMWSSVMQYARVIGSRAFVGYVYGLPRGSPWIEFIGLATVMAKQYKKLIEFGERNLALSTKSPVSWSMSAGYVAGSAPRSTHLAFGVNRVTGSTVGISLRSG
jgi:hypothetical protein